MCAGYKRQLPLQELLDSGESSTFLDFLSVEDFTDAALSDLSAFDLLESVKEEYS
jgi:hypothetical protein